MIRFEKVSKRYPASDLWAVHDLELHIEEGSICVLVGSSGCGKTTTMRMVNRLIEPTEGHITVEGRDISTVDPIGLRLGIGYILQDTGLFPHMTVAQNIATVPAELGWSRQRIAERVEELLELVDLDPALHGGKRPAELSGGQRQRVGVARALAGDPRIMLMDEPFGALDPITRMKLQDQFLAIQRRLRKTIVFVTHDIQEALRMGDTIVVMRQGRVVQRATPSELLTHPADPFVSELVGGQEALKLLALLSCAEVMRPGWSGATAPGLVRASATAQEALSVMLSTGLAEVQVADPEGRPMGRITLEDLFARSCSHA